MTRSKEIFFRISSPLAALLPLHLMAAISQRKLLIPVYHAVSDDPPAHLKYLYRVKSVREFESDLDTLLKHYRAISLEELIPMVRSGKRIEKPVFHITFDDGLSEFYHYAAPVLSKKGIPATCFLNNDFIDGQDIMFRLKAGLLIDHLHHSAAASSSWVNFHDWVQKFDFGKIYYRKLLLDLGYDDTHKLEELAAGLKVDFKAFGRESMPYLSSSQIRELIGKGFTFGAHTHDHRDLREMSEQEQYDAIQSSVEDICLRFGLDYKVFAFPFTDYGLSRNFMERIGREAFCTLSFGCAGIKQDITDYNLQRIPVEDHVSALSGALKKEYLYHFFLRMTGNAIMKRK